MKNIFDLIEKLKSEGNNLAVLVIDEQDYSEAREGEEHLKTKYQRQVILKCSKLEIPSIFIWMDDAPINSALYKAAPDRLKKIMYKPAFNALSSIKLVQELTSQHISHVIIMGIRTDTCVKSTVFGMGPLSSGQLDEIRKGKEFLKEKGIQVEDFIKGIESGLLGLNIQVITAHELVRDFLHSDDMYSRIEWPEAEGLTIFENPQRNRFFSLKKESVEAPESSDNQIKKKLS